MTTSIIMFLVVFLLAMCGELETRYLVYILPQTPFSLIMRLAMRIA